MKKLLLILTLLVSNIVYSQTMLEAGALYVANGTAPVTFDNINIGTGWTLSLDKLTLSTSSLSAYCAISTTYHTVIGAGGLKYQYEIRVNSGLNCYIGITGFPSTFSTYIGSGSNNGYGAYSFSWFLYHNGTPNTTSTSLGYSISPACIDVVLDCNVGSLTYYYWNGSTSIIVGYTSGTPVVTGLTGNWYAGIGVLGGSTNLTAKFTGFTNPIAGAVAW